MDAVVKVFKEQAGQKDLMNVAGLGARLYLMAMWGLVTFSVMGNVSDYADTLTPHKSEPAAVKDFADNGGNLSKLKEMLVASLLAKCKNNKGEQRKKRGLGDQTDSDDISSAEHKK